MFVEHFRISGCPPILLVLVALQLPRRSGPAACQENTDWPSRAPLSTLESTQRVRDRGEVERAFESVTCALRRVFCDVSCTWYIALYLAAYPSSRVAHSMNNCRIMPDNRRQSCGLPCPRVARSTIPKPFLVENAPIGKKGAAPERHEAWSTRSGTTEQTTRMA
jgi:hypothetical protein